MSETPSPPAPRRRLFGVLTFVLVAAILAALTEATFRYREALLRPAPVAMMVENPHGTGSYRLEPGLRTRVQAEGVEVPIEINAHGMRWREVPEEKPPGVRRIAFLGDSFTFGSWSDGVESSFVGVFDALLPPGVEALNFGVGGYGLDEMELLLEEEVLAFSPDVVVVVFFNGNDFRDTLLGAEKYRLVDGTVVWDDDHLAAQIPAEHRPPPRPADPPLAQRFRYFLWDEVATFRAVASLKYARAAEDDPGAEASPFFDRLEPSSEFTVYSFWSRVPYPPVAVEARELSLEVLERIRRRLGGRGIELRVAALPYRKQVYVEEPTGPGYDVAYPQRYVEEWARERGVPYLDLLPPMRAAVRERAARGDPASLYLDFDPHLRDPGHRLVGRLLFEGLTPYGAAARSVPPSGERSGPS